MDLTAPHVRLAAVTMGPAILPLHPVVAQLLGGVVALCEGCLVRLLAGEPVIPPPQADLPPEVATPPEPIIGPPSMSTPSAPEGAMPDV